MQVWTPTRYRTDVGFGAAKVHEARGAFKFCEIELFGLATLLAVNQCLANVVDLEMPLLLASDEITDDLAIVGKAACLDLGRDPCVLLLGQRDRLAHGRHILF